MSTNAVFYAYRIVSAEDESVFHIQNVTYFSNYMVFACFNQHIKAAKLRFNKIKNNINCHYQKCVTKNTTSNNIIHSRHASTDFKIMRSLVGQWKWPISPPSDNNFMLLNCIKLLHSMFPQNQVLKWLLVHFQGIVHTFFLANIKMSNGSKVPYKQNVWVVAHTFSEPCSHVFHDSALRCQMTLTNITAQFTIKMLHVDQSLHLKFKLMANRRRKKTNCFEFQTRQTVKRYFLYILIFLNI